MKAEWLPGEFTVCQIGDVSDADLSASFTFFARTDEEISLACPSERCPENALRREAGWRCFRVAGPLDFSLVGILAKITGCLKDAGIPVFAVSTYNTDYVLVKKEYEQAARRALDQI